MFEDVVKNRLIKELKKHDYDTFEHSERVAKLTHEFGVNLGYSKDDLRLLYESAGLHDIGKVYISNSILKSKGKLSETQYDEILRHPIYSEVILSKFGMPVKMLRVVRGHHENYNGSGYPDKLTHGDIACEAEVIRIIDSYDSMTNDRSYSKAMSDEEALRELSVSKGTLYDPELVDKFIKHMSGKLVETS